MSDWEPLTGVAAEAPAQASEGCATTGLRGWLWRREPLVVLGLIIAGAVLRLWGWAYTLPRPSETMNVAISLVTSGRFADAFRPGSGPTAHVAPIMPLLISAVYRVFGVATPAAEFALCVIAAGLIGLSIGLTYLMMRQLGMRHGARLAAVALASLLPIQFSTEMTDLKVWEAPLAVAGLTGLLALVIRLDLRGVRTIGSLLVPVVIAGFLALLSPPVGLAGFVAIAILVIRRVQARLWFVVAAMTVIVTASFLLPWGAHNRATMGKWILTRSNANLELALVYNDTMLRTTDARLAFRKNIEQIHPTMPNGYIAMTSAGGELAYYDMLGKRTARWVSGHPSGTVVLLARHLRDYVMPPSLLTFQTSHSHVATLRLAYLAAAALLAIAGMPILIARNPRYIYVLAAAVLIVMPYILVQPIIRYRYLIYILSVFLAVETLAIGWAWLRRDRSAASPPDRAR